MQDIQVAIELGVDLMKDIVAAGYSFLKEKNKERDFFGAATKKYVGSLIERYNNVKVLGMREPIPLKSLYVRANILEKISAEHRGLRLEDLEKAFDRDRRTFGKTTEPVDGEIIANRLKKFIVLGKPGAGKTTYLRFLTLMMLDPNSGIEHRRLPIFVTLHDWAQKAVPLMDYLTEQFDISGFEEAQDFVKRMLEQGKFLVLFDGLDEVSREADQDGIIRQIRDFTDKYSDNQFIISCRVATFNTIFERFIDVEIADFNDEQIETFIRNWFHGQPKVASDCWERLKANPQLRELASVPLLLTLICLAYNPDKGDFPQKRSSLYRDAIKVLLEQWDESRPGGRIKRDDIYKKLSRQNKEAMFARIAWGTFTENQYFIEEEHLARMIQIFIKNLPEYQDERTLPDGEQILKQIEAQHGIIVERAKGVYSFAHLTFQEYYAAKYIVEIEKEGALARLVGEHLFDDRWQEVLSLVAEKLVNRDELLLLIHSKIHDLQEDKDVFNFLFEADQIIATPENVLARIHVMLMMVEVERREGTWEEMQEQRKKREEWLRTLTTEQMEEEEEEYKAGWYLLQNEDELCAKIGKLYKATELRHEKSGTFEYYPDLLEEFRRNYKWNDRTLRKPYQFFSANLKLMNLLNLDDTVSKPIREKILNEMLMPRREGE